MAKSNGLTVEVDLATELLRSKSNDVDQIFALMDNNALNMGERIEAAMQKVADKFGVFAGLTQEQANRVAASGDKIGKTYEAIAAKIAQAQVTNSGEDDGGYGRLQQNLEVRRRQIEITDQMIAKVNALRDADGQLDTQSEQSLRQLEASRTSTALRIKEIELEIGALERLGIAEMAAARAREKQAQAEAEAQQLAAQAAATAAEKQAQADARAQAAQAARVADAQARDAALQLAQMADSAERLRGRLDPMYLAQKRFDDELVTAQALLSSGIITEREHADAVRLATESLQKHHAALFATTPPSRELIETTGRSRAAMQQLSYQLNDISIGFATGTPVMQIFAQQSGQVVQALQLMGGEGDKLLSFLGGAWGIGIVSAATVLLPLIGNLDIFKDKVAEAVKKLKEQADETENSAEAQRIFDATLEGSIIKQRAMNLELEKELKTRRQINQEKANEAAQGLETARKNLQDAQTKLSEAQAAAKRAQAAPAVGNAMSGGFSQVERGRSTNEVATAKDELRKAQEAFNLAWRNQRLADLPNIRLSAAALADPKEAERQRIEQARAAVGQGYANGRYNRDEAQALLAELDKQEAANKKNGPSAETLAKRAEAARLKLLSDDTAYSEMERAARHRLLEAMGKTADTEEQRFVLRMEDINAEADAERRKIDNRKAADKNMSDAEYSRLILLNEANRFQRLENAELEQASQDVRDASDADIRSLDAKIAKAKIEADMAKTAADRRAAQLTLLDLEEKKVKADAQKVLADPMASASDKQAANDRIKQVDASHDANVAKTLANTSGPLETYRKRLLDDAGDIQTALEDVAVKGLGRFEDQFAAVISGTQSVAGAFKSMATSILADLARLAIKQALMKLLNIKTSGFAEGGKVKAYASGGRISGPGTGTSDSILALLGGTEPILVSNGEAIMNARATAQYWPILDAMNKGRLPRFADGGLVSPRIPSLAGLGRIAGAGSAPNVTFDLRGAVMTEDLLRQMNAIGERNAAVSIAVAPQMAQREMTDLANRRIP